MAFILLSVRSRRRLITDYLSHLVAIVREQITVKHEYAYTSLISMRCAAGN